MFDFFETPWKNDSSEIEIKFKEINTDKQIHYWGVIGTSITFFKDFIQFQTISLNKSNPKKYITTVRFQTKNILFFDYEALYEHHDNLEPLRYIFNFHFKFELGIINSSVK